MKKILFALAGVLTLALTACFDGTGSSYTQSFSRVVTIDTTQSSVELIADYTEEVFKNFTNLKYTEQLAQFGLEDAQRAEVLMQVHVDASYTQTLTMLQGEKIDIQPTTNKMPTDSLKPLTGWQQYPLGGTTFTPTVWVSDRYLNVLPVIPSSKAGKYYLMPDSAVSDTLYFSLKASYETDESKSYYERIQCFDLSTLCDTANADTDLRAKMKNLWSAMERHRSDSMRIVLTSLFDIHYYQKDTIMEQSSLTNYFRPSKVLDANK